MKILFTGGRYFSNEKCVERVLRTFLASPGASNEVIVGDCPTGADMLVRQFCERRGIAYVCAIAKWSESGLAAAPLRNQWMVDQKPDICIAFPGISGAGTTDCTARAHAAKIPVLRVEP